MKFLKLIDIVNVMGEVGIVDKIRNVWYKMS